MRRRESLVTDHPVITPSSPTHQEGPSEDTSTPVQEAQEAVSPTSSQTVSRSQQIASSVLAGGSVEPPSLKTPGLGSQGQLSPDMAKLLAALSAGQGASGNPVHVVIKERESSRIVYGLPTLTPVTGKGAWIPSFARFLVFAGIATFCKFPYACCKEIYSDYMQSSSPYFPSWSRTPGSSRLLPVNPNSKLMNPANLFASATYTVWTRQKRSSKTWSRF